MSDRQVTIRVDETDAAAIEQEALRQGMSVEEFLSGLAARAAKIARDEAWFEGRVKRAKEVDWDWFQRFLNREGGEPPRPGDEVE